MREYDEENRCFKDKPFHNWASHSSDSFSYFAVTWRETFQRPEMSMPTTYQMDF